MNEILLIDMMSYLDPELLENDYIESDMNKFNSLFGKLIGESDEDNKLHSIIKIITLMSTSMVVIAGVVAIIIKRKKGFKLKTKSCFMF